MKIHTKYLSNILIAYHKTIKCKCNKRPYDTKHDCLENVNLPIFKHLVATKVINFPFSIIQSNSPCLSSHKYYFCVHSNCYNEIKKFLYEKYLNHDVVDNPSCAVLACIQFNQRHEPQTIIFHCR